MCTCVSNSMKDTLTVTIPWSKSVHENSPKTEMSSSEKTWLLFNSWWHAPYWLSSVACFIFTALVSTNDVACSDLHTSRGMSVSSGMLLSCTQKERKKKQYRRLYLELFGPYTTLLYKGYVTIKGNFSRRKSRHYINEPTCKSVKVYEYDCPRSNRHDMVACRSLIV